MSRTPLDQLRIIERDRILPFEWPLSEDSAPSIDEPVLRHPPAVLPLDESGYLLLSGAGTVRALEYRDIDHLPVQICSADQLTITGGLVVLLRFGLDDLRRIVARAPERFEVIEHSRASRVEADGIRIGFRFVSGPTGTIILRDSGRVGCPIALDMLARAILQEGSYFGASDPHAEPSNMLDLPGLTGTLTLPPFTVDDLKAAARTDRLFPPSLLDVRIGGRVLNLDFPLSVLVDSSPAPEKEAFLRDLILLRLRRRCLTFHPDGVYLLNS